LRTTPATDGVSDLSGREVEVLRLVADGRSNKEIGETLGLSALTVKSHLARISRKLGTGDRAEMVALAMRAGVIR
jgi:DNA-binding CsgD family transcriptional regulator